MGVVLEAWVWAHLQSLLIEGARHSSFRAEPTRVFIQQDVLLCCEAPLVQRVTPSRQTRPSEARIFLFFKNTVPPAPKQTTTKNCEPFGLHFHVSLFWLHLLLRLHVLYSRCKLKSKNYNFPFVSSLISHPGGFSSSLGLSGSWLISSW